MTRHKTSLLIVVMCILLSLLVCSVVKNERSRSEIRFLRVCASVSPGMLDYKVEQSLNMKPQYVSGKGWPANLGDLPRYRLGCPVSLLVESNASEMRVISPNSDIVWLVWTSNSGSWLAVACLGVEGQRNRSGFLIVEKHIGYTLPPAYMP